MRSRSRARSWALQAMYAWESRGAEGSPARFIDSFLLNRRINAEAEEYLRTLIDMIDAHLGEIDHELDSSLENWRMERLAVIDRNVLRIGAAELLFSEDVPPRVAIQEAIRLAERFSTHQSARFVNGVLDALMRANDRSAGEVR
jgi:transcription antitermination protein NusB